MTLAKPFNIPKSLVWEAYKLVKSNGGAAGVDDESLADFDKDRNNNLYCLWNRISSGSYFPPAVKAVPIPKKSGGVRVLGIPTVSGRIAQMVVKLMLMNALENRMRECGLEIHPDKTRIVYCKDLHRRGKYKHIKFDFLGYTFRPRKAIDKFGRCFANFLPAVSSSSKRAIIQKIRNWHIQLKTDKSLQDIANMFGPILRGWANYYGKFYQYAMRPVWVRFNLDTYSRVIVGWSMQEHLKRSLILDSLNMAYKNRGGFLPGIIFHSDKGSQYSSGEVKKYLKINSFHQSMSNDCYENSITETFFATLKKE